MLWKSQALQTDTKLVVKPKFSAPLPTSLRTLLSLLKISTTTKVINCLNYQHCFAKHMKKILILIFILGAISFNLAEAHPFIVKTDPIQSSNVPSGTNQIVIHYSELVEKDYSTIKVLDSQGNQVDNKDTKYFEGEDSLVVTTKPLGDGVYTVTSKVLSKVDGHIVDDAFVFAVGNAKPPPPPQKTEPVVYLPEAGARFPGIVGQVIVLGATISSLLIWNPIRKKPSLRDNGTELDNQHSHAFLKLTGVGLFLVLASNIVMLAVQSIALQTLSLIHI